MAIEVMYRLGRPWVFTTCQPSDVPAFAGFDPPTFVASPRLKKYGFGPSLFKVSHCPQNPTYAAFLRTATADMELSGSVPDEVAAASPGCDRVPRSKTFSHVVVVSSAALASVIPSVVSGPIRVSATSRPAVSRCFAFVGSIANGLENFDAVKPGSMLP